MQIAFEAKHKCVILATQLAKLSIYFIAPSTARQPDPGASSIYPRVYLFVHCVTDWRRTISQISMGLGDRCSTVLSYR